MKELTEIKADEVLINYKTVSKGIKAMESIEDFIAENGIRPVRVCNDRGVPLFASTIDWELKDMMEGGTFYAYLQLRDDGFVDLGNEAMRESGHLQKVSWGRLMQIDYEYNL